ncbi:hypothetical protein J1605_019296 [Eschrichtius robustus]|uniref:Uncharacterized protein n=1 Tax=Eschrichtius robustus TaxID=9764 RepID=A0AB34HQR7_ESCRO|nr:hypothetical protein J1605_019296 [Eschrichtius robustus]
MASATTNFLICKMGERGDDQLNVFEEDTMGGFMEDLRKCKIIFLIGQFEAHKNTRDVVDTPIAVLMSFNQQQSADFSKLLKPMRLEPVLHNKRSHRNEKPAHRNEE